jgi:hypothetical protein
MGESKRSSLVVGRCTFVIDEEKEEIHYLVLFV